MTADKFVEHVARMTTYPDVDDDDARLTLNPLIVLAREIQRCGACECVGSDYEVIEEATK